MDSHFMTTVTYINAKGETVEINEVVYDRTDGKGVDYVKQIKINGVEVGHITEHPDGTIHIHGDCSELN